MLCLSLMMLAAAVLGQGLADRWWDARGDRRCALAFAAVGEAVGHVPVVISGSKLKELVFQARGSLS